MSTPSNPATESSLEARVMTPADVSASRHLYWSLRRELWEYRSIYLAPLIVAGLTVFGLLIATIGRAMSVADLERRRAILEEPYTFASLLIMGTVTIVAVFYCLDTLEGERRDRSILFWKSLPVSDATAVLAKVSIPIAILPVIGFTVTIVMQLVMLMLSSLAMLGSGLDVSSFWTHASFFESSMALLFHLVGIHGLWYAPIYAWLLLVSAWAPRAALLWAALPPFAIAVIEKIAFNSAYFRALLADRFGGGSEGARFLADAASLHPLAHLSVARFLTSPGLWLGLAVAAVFLAAAVHVRRSRDPI